MKSIAWSIGDVAARLGVPTHALRHWEDMGLLEPSRDSTGRRRYRAEDLTRAAVVVRSKAAGLTLEQVRALLDGNAPRRHEVLTAHLAELDRRATEVTRMREMTAHAFECTAHDIAACPRFAHYVADLLTQEGRER